MTNSASVHPAADARAAGPLQNLVVGGSGWYGPGAQGDPPANVHGFIVSQFPQLVYHVVRGALGESAAFTGKSRGVRTGIVLGTICGDSVTADTVCQRLAVGTVHNPMLFFQSVPTSVLGALCRDYGITGPVSCISEQRETAARLLATADELLDEDGIDEVLAIGIELVPNERVEAAIDQRDPGIRSLMPSENTAVALSLSRAFETRPPSERRPQPAASTWGWMHDLIEICNGSRVAVAATSLENTELT